MKRAMYETAYLSYPVYPGLRKQSDAVVCADSRLHLVDFLATGRDDASISKPR